MISLPTDSTKLNVPPQRAPEPSRPSAHPQADPRKASEIRKPGSIVPKAPAEARTSPISETRRPAPTSPMPRPPEDRPSASAPPSGDEEDPEKLLREYAERQKTKVTRLEQQLTDHRKVSTERDSYRSKSESLAKELLEAKKQLEASAKNEEVIKDLQGKVDAAILSNSILTDDKEKLKKALSQQTENLKKAEDRAAHAEKALAEAQKALATQTEARHVLEGRISAALHALQAEGKPSATRPPEDRGSATRPPGSPAVASKPTIVLKK